MSETCGLPVEIACRSTPPFRSGVAAGDGCKVFRSSRSEASLSSSPARRVPAPSWIGPAGARSPSVARAIRPGRWRSPIGIDFVVGQRRQRPGAVHQAGASALPLEVDQLIDHEQRERQQRKRRRAHKNAQLRPKAESIEPFPPGFRRVIARGRSVRSRSVLHGLLPRRGAGGRIAGCHFHPLEGQFGFARPRTGPCAAMLVDQQH